MVVTLSGIVMLVRLLQPENALYPMVVTLSGIVILVSLVQPANAPSRMDLNLVGMTTVPPTTSEQVGNEQSIELKGSDG